MILTVTINPLLEKVLYFKSLNEFSANRSYKEELKAGGKGINVSRQLNYLGVENLAFTFLGSNNGKDLRSTLTKEGINFTAIASKSETRWGTVIHNENDNSIKSYFSPNQELTEKEVTDFIAKLEKVIPNHSIIVLSGSSPCKEADRIFPAAIEIANNEDKIVVLDTYGDHLEECIKAAPTVVHNNVDEVENSLSINLKEDESKIDFLNNLYDKGVKLSFLTEGGKPFYSSKFDFNYKIFPKQVIVKDATGSGDAFTAGIVYGLHYSFVFDEFTKIAAALGSLNAESFDTCKVDKEKAMHLSASIEIESIGKRMKLIDDSPNY